MVQIRSCFVRPRVPLENRKLRFLLETCMFNQNSDLALPRQCKLNPSRSGPHAHDIPARHTVGPCFAIFQRWYVLWPCYRPGWLYRPPVSSSGTFNVNGGSSIFIYGRLHDVPYFSVCGLAGAESCNTHRVQQLLLVLKLVDSFDRVPTVATEKASI